MSDEQGEREVSLEDKLFAASGLMEGLVEDGLVEEDQEPDDTELEDEAEGAEDDAPEEESDDLNEEIEVDDAEDDDEDPEETPDEANEGPAQLDLTDETLDSLVTIKVDGEEQEVPLREALAGTMRQEAFTRKTQELAEQRRAIQAELQGKREERQKYAQGLETLEQVLEAAQPAELTVEQIKAASPEELEAFEQHKERLAQVKAERERVQQEAMEDFQEAQQALIAEESEKLVAALDLVDKEVRTKRLTELSEYAQESFGYTPEELAAVTDHRVLVILDKARQFDSMSEKGKEVRTKAKKAPVLKPGSTSGKKSSKDKRKEAARSRLSTTKDLRQVAAAFEDFVD